ncbi:CoB--CoM heterodisulfide reductase subunit C [Methanobacterium paludis]|uniref:CoB/CoM heterodisulfide reductase, subunit C n=1 Tax=Methanobacterium paludis (strain DSM 25820 / JCM 18151 / SWAN1) TaxID=868131 RepID=F6D1U0_METPW|nr:CoB--CoM heterodisulfide reductase subunit C [Methanobacterium paludis]AEG18567.1 CoB/CoM heterodisulfide reductase, subunit C [Methanobacterium paludis]
MKTLKRLKKMLTGDEEPDKEEAENSVEQSDSEVKTEKAVEDKKQKTVEETETTESVTQKKETIKDPQTEEEVPKTTEKQKESETKIESTEPETVTEKENKSDKTKTERSGSMTLLEGIETDVITRENIDTDFKQQIMDAGAETVAICFQCGTCTGACPSGRRTPYRIRSVVRRAVMGLKDDVLSDDTIWMCTTCYECQERCPRGIKIVDIVKAVRNEAAKAGYMAPAHKATGSFVLKTGHGVPINSATKELRKRVGLTELPPTTHEFPEALKELQTMMKRTGFDKLVGYNWETGELE